MSVAQHLASYIGGKRTDGLVFAEYFHNDRNTFRNHIIRFEPKPQALTLDRLIVVTTGGSASASELVINALRPFIPVAVIGSRTYGKPVGQYAIEFCDKLLAPVSFALRNADGQGDFFDGFPAGLRGARRCGPSAGRSGGGIAQGSADVRDHQRLQRASADAANESCDPAARAAGDRVAVAGQRVLRTSK